mgnify:CR=1 FL=1
MKVFAVGTSCTWFKRNNTSFIIDAMEYEVNKIELLLSDKNYLKSSCSEIIKELEDLFMIIY